MSRRTSAATTARTAVVPLSLIALACAIAIGAWVWLDDEQLKAAGVQIVLTWAVVTLVIVRAWRTGLSSGYCDPFHPSIFPLAYVAFSFLAPLWMAFVVGEPPGGLARPTPLASNTTLLLAFGVLAFSAGTFLTARSPKTRVSTREFSAQTVVQAGRVLIILPICVSAYKLITGSLAQRGMDQVSASFSDVFSTMLSPVAIASITLMLIGNRVQNAARLLGTTDFILVGVLVVVTAGRGTRGDIIAMVLLILVAHANRKKSYWPVVWGVIIMMVLGVAILQYRASAQGNSVDESPIEILLGDLAVAGYTTGATAAAVPEMVPFEWGGTYVQAILRQLPSMVINPLIGPPTETGPRIFREIVGLESQNQGYGFSIPAEGYLNFGIVGVILACGVLGLLFNWAYPRMSFVNGRALGVLYPVLVASLPFGLRADSLGFAKNVIYPLIAVAIVLAIARSVSRNVGDDGPMSKHHDAKR